MATENFEVSDELGRMSCATKLPGKGIVCRLCLESNEQHMYSIFQSTMLFEKIIWVSDLKMSDKDDMPSHVCKKCQFKLDFAFEFKTMCWASDKSLRLQSYQSRPSYLWSNETNDDLSIKGKETMRDNVSVNLPNIEVHHAFQNVKSPNTFSIIDDKCEAIMIGSISPLKEDKEEKKLSIKSVDKDIGSGSCNCDSDFQTDPVATVEHSLTSSEKDANASFTSKNCEKVFTQRRELKEHERNNKMSLLCSVCGAFLCSQARLDNHLRRHKGIRPFTCHTCPKSFYQQSEMTNHLRSHVGVKSHLCSICGKLFSLKTSLVAHLKSHSGVKPFRCSACDKCFTFLGALKVHLRSHTGERPFRCPHCSKTFSMLGNLQTHVRTHTGLKPFVCVDCDRRFSQKGDLTIHVRSHTGEKPFCCLRCPSTFFCKGNLVKHMRAHDGVRPYSCSTCAKTFALKSTLNSHVRSHGGLKSFHCSQCPKSFTQPSSLSKHIRSHSGEKNYKCHECEKAFMRNDHLQRHLHIHTRVGSNP